MNYKKVDFSTWPRGDLFQFYMDHMRVVMSLTVDMDVTPLVRFVKQRGMKFYPAMIWVVSRVINAHEEFKLGWDQDGNLIRWDFVSPSYAHFHPEDGNFTKLVTPYMEDLPAFHARFLEDREKYRELRAWWKGSQRITSMCPVCPGFATATSMSMCLTRGTFWPRWSPGASTRRRAAGWSYR